VITRSESNDIVRRHGRVRPAGRLLRLRTQVGTTGRNGDVLKTRPPFSFEERHAQMLLAALEEALQIRT
jgi:4-aminobutyrate aminotransferase-like enzyme